MSYLDSEIVSYPTPDQERLYTIYKATNLVNGKCYIGFDSNWPNRRNVHFNSSSNKKCTHYNCIFHRAIRKYGKEKFKWEVLYQDFNGFFILNAMEPFFIERYRSFVGFDDCNGYNMTVGGEGTPGYWLDKKRSKKDRESMTKGQLRYYYQIINTKNDELICFNNLREYCKSTNLHRYHLTETLRNTNTHKGYKMLCKIDLLNKSFIHPNKNKFRVLFIYEIQLPNGLIVVEPHIEQFFRKENMCYKNIRYHFSRGNSYKGYKLVNKYKIIRNH